jgi:hypothetical protein
MSARLLTVGKATANVGIPYGLPPGAKVAVARVGAGRGRRPLDEKPAFSGMEDSYTVRSKLAYIFYIAK